MRVKFAAATATALVAIAGAATAQAASAADPGFPFETVSQYALSSGQGPIAVGDFNDDGNIDLLVVDSDGGARTWAGDGASNFSPAGPASSFPTDIREVQTADLNDDDVPDIVTASGANPVSVEIRLADGQGSFDLSDQVSLAKYQPEVFLGDIDGDGDLEILTRRLIYGPVDPRFDDCAPTTGMVRSYSTDGSGHLAGSTDTPIENPEVLPPRCGTFFDTPAVGDFNADGRDDLAFAYAGSAVHPPGPLVVMDGQPDGSLVQRTGTTATTPGHTGYVVARLDDDQFDDLIGYGTNFFNSLTWPYSYVNQGGADFSDPTSLPRGSVRAEAASRPVVSDFDHDGNVDVAAATFNGSQAGLAFWAGNGDGAFADPLLDSASRVYGIFEGDFDNDGWVDVATTGDGGLLIHRNIAAPPEQLGLEVGPLPSRMSLHDLDRDGLNFDATCEAACEVSARLRTKARAAANEGLGGTMLSTVFSPLTEWATVNVGNHSKAMGKVMRSYRGRAFKARLKIIATPVDGDQPAETMLRKLRLKR